ncbi:hypothetical protein FE783_11915 [Paenibacillus mesophilus]|uniref:hypothetical protein n=1 Tax=Paenibacillus mesophilus TaxID=2582849 RepID=UPI00110D3CE3|nr:hypothetical protein [Paenibacillus mesophilus]TMV50252.1 hypothetical protein FE783_11915 [Paenibacillus mesophilus]
MSYYISYKGKSYGHPMTKEEAVSKMMRMRHAFVGLDIVQTGVSGAEEAAAPKRTGRPAHRQVKNLISPEKKASPDSNS